MICPRRSETRGWSCPDGACGRVGFCYKPSKIIEKPLSGPQTIPSLQYGWAGKLAAAVPQVRLTPTDILKLLRPPIGLPGSSLTAIERLLSRRREPLVRAMKARTRQDFVPQSRNLQMPSTARLEGLLEQIE